MVTLIAPRVLVLVGGISAKAVFGVSDGITRQRGIWRTYHPRGSSLAIPATAIFHPAYLLRKPLQKRKPGTTSWRLSAAWPPPTARPPKGELDPPVYETQTRDRLVLSSKTPLAGMPLSRWYAFNAAAVRGPNRPSTGPGSYPLAVSKSKSTPHSGDDVFSAPSIRTTLHATPVQIIRKFHERTHPSRSGN